MAFCEFKILTSEEKERRKNIGILGITFQNWPPPPHHLKKLTYLTRTDVRFWGNDNFGASPFISAAIESKLRVTTLHI